MTSDQEPEEQCLFLEVPRQVVYHSFTAELKAYKFPKSRTSVVDKERFVIHFPCKKRTITLINPTPDRLLCPQEVDHPSQEPLQCAKIPSRRPVRLDINCSH